MSERTLVRFGGVWIDPTRICAVSGSGRRAAVNLDNGTTLSIYAPFGEIGVDYVIERMREADSVIAAALALNPLSVGQENQE